MKESTERTTDNKAVLSSTNIVMKPVIVGSI